MRPLHRIFALLTLLTWLFAAGHVALEHGGVADGGAQHALLGCVNGGDHDDGGPAQDGEHHQHHDLTALGDTQRLKSAEQKALAPAWVPISISICEALAMRLADLFGEKCGPCLRRAHECAPADERAFGWLLVCRVAHPVRGPSVAV